MKLKRDTGSIIHWGNFPVLICRVGVNQLLSTGDHVLRSNRRQGLLSSFCLRGNSGCKDIFSKIFFLDKIFEILAEGSTLESPRSLAIMEGEVIFHSKTSKTVWLRFWMFHPELTLDGFKDVLDREPQWSKFVVHSISSKWTLLVV